MINANELRLGNYIEYDPKQVDEGTEIIPLQVTSVSYDDKITVDDGYTNLYDTVDFNPIQITPEILLACGFSQLPHFTVQDLWEISIGRDRVISVACVGTPNEMIFITEQEPPVVKETIVIRNYDYDGRTYLHQLMNLYHSITGEDIIYKP